MTVEIRRVYDAPAGKGTRVLIDRLWPRGLSKAGAAIDHWIKEVAPSPELRKWFDHDPSRWVEFQRRYRLELDANPEPVARLRELAKGRTLVLLFAARDAEHNNAVVLRNYLLERAP